MLVFPLPNNRYKILINHLLFSELDHLGTIQVIFLIELLNNINICGQKIKEIFHFTQNSCFIYFSPAEAGNEVLAIWDSLHGNLEEDKIPKIFVRLAKVLILLGRFEKIMANNFFMLFINLLWLNSFFIKR